MWARLPTRKSPAKTDAVWLYALLLDISNEGLSFPHPILPGTLQQVVYFLDPTQVRIRNLGPSLGFFLPNASPHI